MLRTVPLAGGGKQQIPDREEYKPEQKRHEKIHCEIEEFRSRPQQFALLAGAQEYEIYRQGVCYRQDRHADNRRAYPGLERDAGRGDNEREIDDRVEGYLFGYVQCPFNDVP